MIKQLIFLITTLAFNACVDQGSSDIDFTIFNQTEKKVTIIAFNTKNEVTGVKHKEPFKANVININPNSKYNVVRVSGVENTGLMFYSIYSVDSVRVIFNDARVKVFLRTPPNPCDICDGDSNHQYFITEQDYKDAEDCNENCE